MQVGNAINFFGHGLIAPFEIIYPHQTRGFVTATAGFVLAEADRRGGAKRSRRPQWSAGLARLAVRVAGEAPRPRRDD